MAKKTNAVEVLEIQSLRRQAMQVRLIGDTMLCTHQWSEKAKSEIRDKKAKKSKAGREACDARAEWDAAFYRDDEGNAALPVIMLKKALISAAHKDFGVTKGAVAQSVFVRGKSGGGYMTPIIGEPLPFEAPETEDAVRVGSGLSKSADLRYRPKWREWAIDVEIEFCPDIISAEQLLFLLTKSGFGVGLAEGRPEKMSGLDWGRFHPDLDNVKIGEPQDIQESIRRAMGGAQ